MTATAALHARIADMALARSEGIAATVLQHVRANPRRAERLLRQRWKQRRRATLDITPWLEWFLACLGPRLRSGRGNACVSPGKGAFLGVGTAMSPFNDRQRASSTGC